MTTPSAAVLAENLQWIEDCLKWRGRVLRGKYAHWCHDWDGLPVDETTDEIECCCCFRDEPPP